METPSHRLTGHILKVKRTMFSAPPFWVSHFNQWHISLSAIHSFIVQSFLQLVRSVPTMHLTSLGLLSIASFFLVFWGFFGVWDLSSLCPPQWEWRLNHWTTREVPDLLLKRVQELGSSPLGKKPRILPNLAPASLTHSSPRTSLC